ncbi:hypothetical protein HYH02_005001 [Chlamydomonas schloesseri]|uniref:Neurochondrin n=1 Tax=Chlamydomonas schloesseri TaxID=2026947 RepID=A0A836B8E2_9CHLO|nr:hypothetical protein HYH02_005001 [Chlamydomonas schloesseri]|eukprot:KAG2450500.1 hypothetical protein HYH02_005001 [Chlamydomonas schloesseri]
MPEERGGANASPAAPDWNRSFQQCLELLKGPGDERRFVGLLLVTRLLPQGSDDAVRRVLEALGWTFLQRLLLPLRRQPGASAAAGPAAVSGDAAAQQASCVGLALSILAAACRLPDVAAGAEVRESLPLLLRVVRMGGVSPVLAASGVALPAVEPAADAAAVTDALECLVAAAAASPAATCAVLDGAGALSAVAEALTRMAAVLTAPAAAATADSAAAAGQGEGEGEGRALEAAAHSGALLAMSLLERLVAGGAAATAPAPAAGAASRRAVALLSEHPAAAAKAVAALSQLVGNRRLLASSQAKAPAAPAEQPADGASGASRNNGSSTSAGGGAAQLQLEAMHLLLLLLRACQQPAAAAASDELRGLDVATAATTTQQPRERQQLQPGSWSAAVRRGLGWLLRSRVPPALKHAAIELAALTVGVVGERWLLGAGQVAAAQDPSAARPQPQGQVKGQGQEDAPGAFLQLVAEILKIELGMLLHDAMHPSRTVPASAAPGGLRSAARDQAAAPQPSQRLLDELAQRAARLRAEQEAAARKAAEAAAAAGAAETAQIEGGAAAGSAAGAGAEAMEVESTATGTSGTGAAAPAAAAAAAAAAATAAAAAGGAVMLAGDRALLLLPACYSLLESCVGAVATDAAAGDEDEDGIDAMERDEPAGRQRARPELPDAVLGHLMRVFHEVAETLLEFFQAAAGAAAAAVPGASDSAAAVATAAGPSSSAAAPASADDAEAVEVQVAPALLLGAGRVLGRYYAEAPQAMLSDKVLAALPAVMAARDEPAAAAAAAVGADDGDGGDEGTYALTFLLPGLLQATGEGFQGRAEACKALQGAPAALEACVAYLGHCVRRAAAAAAFLDAHLPRPQQQQLTLSVTVAAGAAAATAAAVRASPALAAACSEAAAAEAGLADVCMLLCNLMEPAALAAACGRRAGTAGDVAEGAWAAVRRTVSDAGAAAAAAVEAAATAGAVQLSPVLALLQPAVWLVLRWSEARSGTLQALSGMDVLSSARPSGSGARAEGAAAQVLAAAQLAPRALLCPACLVSVAVAATMRRLADAPATASPLPRPEHASSGAAGAAGAILPPALLEGVSRLAVAAASAGASLELASLQRALEASEEWRQTEERLRQQARGQGGAAPSGSGLAGPEVDMGGEGGVPHGARAGWLTPAAAYADFAGDAASCWERLLGALAQVVEVSDAARGLARAAPAIQGLAAAVAAQAGGGVAGEAAVPGPAQELLLDVNLALLLQVVMAAGR